MDVVQHETKQNRMVATVFCLRRFAPRIVYRNKYIIHISITLITRRNCISQKNQSIIAYDIQPARFCRGVYARTCAIGLFRGEPRPLIKRSTSLAGTKQLVYQANSTRIEIFRALPRNNCFRTPRLSFSNKRQSLARARVLHQTRQILAKQQFNKH